MVSLLFAAALLVPAPAPPVDSVARLPEPVPAVWRIDPNHSGVNFRIRHFVTKVRGNFKDFTGTITADPDAWQGASIEVEIKTASISTDNDRRDADLRSSNFFAVDSFPTISFKSTRVERSGDDAKIYGMLTIKGITRPVVLDGHFNGVMKTGQVERVGFEAKTTIDRTQFGVTWNRALEGGGAMLGDDVEVEITVEAVKARS